MICNAGYVLQADGTCSACGAGALKCTDSANHTECLPGFFLNDKLCATCGTGSNALTCVSATEHKTCEVSYKLDATTKLCVTCGDNIESCTASSIT